MTAQKRDKKWAFNSTQKDMSITPLKPAGMRIPAVYYTPEVWAVITLAVQHCTKEVGWLGMVTKLDNGDYLIDKIYIPEQTVSGAETDISADAMAALAAEIFAEGDDPSRLKYWGHSHVNMGVGPSGQDETQVEEYLDSHSVFLRGIYNKRGESKVDIYDRTQGVVFQCVPNSVQGLSHEDEAAWIAVINRNVQERSYTQNLTPTTSLNNGVDPVTKKSESRTGVPGKVRLRLPTTTGGEVFASSVVGYEPHKGVYQFPYGIEVEEGELTFTESAYLDDIIEVYTLNTEFAEFGTQMSL